MHVYLYYALDSINKQTVFISTTAKPSLNILSAIYLTLGLLSEEMKNSNIQPEQICWFCHHDNKDCWKTMITMVIDDPKHDWYKCSNMDY